MFIKPHKTLTKLEAFKDWMQDGFVEHCREQYGDNVYYTYIVPHITDMLANMECDVETLMSRVITEDEKEYTELYQGE